MATSQEPRHFVVIGWDRMGEDHDERRKAAARPHLERVIELRKAGEIALGARIHDDDGVVIGSVIITNHASRAAVEEYLSTEPLCADVWERVEVHPLFVPDVYL